MTTWSLHRKRAVMLITLLKHRPNQKKHVKTVAHCVQIVFITCGMIMHAVFSENAE